MSAKLGAMTQWMPKSVSAQGACSRLEPQPKLSPATMILACRYGPWFSTKSGFSEPSARKRISSNRCFARPVRLIVRRCIAGNILSVSILIIGIGAAIPVSCVNFSILPSCTAAPACAGRNGFCLAELAYVRQVAGDGSGGSHRRAHQMGLGVLALAALEIAVRGRGDTLAVLGPIIVHRHAIRAAGLAPFEARFEEHAVQPLLLGLVFHEAGAWHDERPNPFGDAPALGDRRGGAQILDAAVGAGADKD